MTLPYGSHLVLVVVARWFKNVHLVVPYAVHYHFERFCFPHHPCSCHHRPHLTCRALVMPYYCQFFYLPPAARIPHTHLRAFLQLPPIHLFTTTFVGLNATTLPPYWFLPYRRSYACRTHAPAPYFATRLLPAYSTTGWTFPRLMIFIPSTVERRTVLLLLLPRLPTAFPLAPFPSSYYRLLVLHRDEPMRLLSPFCCARGFAATTTPTRPGCCLAQLPGVSTQPTTVPAIVY